MSDMPDGAGSPIVDLHQLLQTSYKFLGYSAMALRLEDFDRQLYGKWCRRCDGIWFGLALEVQCPRCGNRKG